MLSVVIATHNDQHALLTTLAALVAGALEGIVYEVVLADSGSCDATARIADDAGCRVMISQERRGARLKAAAATARAPWLLFLSPGIVPGPSWIEESRRFMEQAELDYRSGASAATFRLGPATSRPKLVQVLAMLGAALVARSTAADGLLISRTFYDAIGGHRDIDEPERDLMRRLGRRRLVSMRAGTSAPCYTDT
jgi:glycosyltransferase involved in cell wall biosynthesis